MGGEWVKWVTGIKRYKLPLESQSVTGMYKVNKHSMGNMFYNIGITLYAGR